jgi:hypothetical protein
MSRRGAGFYRRVDGYQRERQATRPGDSNRCGCPIVLMGVSPDSGPVGCSYRARTGIVRGRRSRGSFKERVAAALSRHGSMSSSCERIDGFSAQHSTEPHVPACRLCGFPTNALIRFWIRPALTAEDWQYSAPDARRRAPPSRGQRCCGCSRTPLILPQHDLNSLRPSVAAVSPPQAPWRSSSELTSPTL